jgi:hypothetical protein
MAASRRGDVEGHKGEKRLPLECCTAMGREPAALSRSLLLFRENAEKAYTSKEGFMEVVEDYMDVGISEFIVYELFQGGALQILRACRRGDHTRPPRLTDQNLVSSIQNTYLD